MRLGIDIGGTKTEVVLVDKQGTVLRLVRIPTGYGPTGVIQSTNEAIAEIMSSAAISADDVTAVGVGVPGRVNRLTGVATHVVNLGCETLDLGKGIGGRFGFAVHVENDVNVAALGMWHQLHIDATSLPIESMAFLNLGTGVAAGIVLSGRLWRGSRGTAGEVGHISVDPSGPDCACGQQGCIEAMASGPAVARQWPNSDPALLQTLYSAVTEGDQNAHAVWAKFIHNVAAAVRVLILTIDVEVVVIGGGAAMVGVPFLNDVREALSEQVKQSPFLSLLELAGRVQLAPNSEYAAVGAAMMATANSVATQALVD